MRKLIFFTIIFCTFSNYSIAKIGKGSLQLSKNSMEMLMQYMYGASNPKYEFGKNKKNKPMLMTISKDGNSTHYYYCPYNSCESGNYRQQSIEKCEKYSQGSKCYVFALGRKIVWKNNGDKSLRRIKYETLKNPFNVAKQIKDLGFYNGDIAKLTGINVSTGQLVEDKEISGKVIDNSIYPRLISTLSQKHKSSWKEYIEGGNEKYKAWVMAKRSDGDMTWGWSADNTSWSDVIKRAFNRCDGYVSKNKKNYPDNTICVLYYKGKQNTTDKEKIDSAINFYGKNKSELFFSKYSYVLENNFNENAIINNDQSKNISSQILDLKKLLDDKIITQEEFNQAKKKILE